MLDDRNQEDLIETEPEQGTRTYSFAPNNYSKTHLFAHFGALTFDGAAYSGGFPK